MQQIFPWERLHDHEGRSWLPQRGAEGETDYNNNNDYLERLTRTGPKRLHVLYKYTLSKFNAYNMNAHTHTHAHTETLTHQSHIRAIRAMRLKKWF